MQSLAFLWFELQMTKQCLSEKTSSAAQVPAKATNLHAPIGIGHSKTRRSASLTNAGPGYGMVHFHLWPMSRR
jgi:hypothetical protein